MAFIVKVLINSLWLQRRGIEWFCCNPCLQKHWKGQKSHGLCFMVLPFFAASDRSVCHVTASGGKKKPLLSEVNWKHLHQFDDLILYVRKCTSLQFMKSRQGATEVICWVMVLSKHSVQRTPDGVVFLIPEALGEKYLVFRLISSCSS